MHVIEIGSEINSKTTVVLERLGGLGQEKVVMLWIGMGSMHT